MSTIDSPAIGTATINAVSVDCPAKTNLTLHVGPSHAEWGGRHELDTIYCAVGVYDTVTATRKAPGSGFSLNLEGAYLGRPGLFRQRYAPQPRRAGIVRHGRSERP